MDQPIPYTQGQPLHQGIHVYYDIAKFTVIYVSMYVYVEMARRLVHCSDSRVPASDRCLYSGLYAWCPPGPDDRLHGGMQVVYKYVITCIYMYNMHLRYAILILNTCSLSIACLHKSLFALIVVVYLLTYIGSG